MTKPTVLVLSGYGLNCEDETKFAFDLAGARTEIVHINDILDHPKALRQYQILVVPGGFSYGDDTGSGNAFAYKMKSVLWPELLSFVAGDRLVIGICNGFQILVSLGLLPGVDGRYGQRQAALLPNDSARYVARWTDLAVENLSPWLRNIFSISLPIAHGEGKFYAPAETMDQLNKQKQVAARYTVGEVCSYQQLPANPTGTLDNIAAVTDRTGRILGIMPHPERAIFFTQLPHWPYLKEKYRLEGKKIPKYGPGLTVFKNAINYFG